MRYGQRVVLWVCAAALAGWAGGCASDKQTQYFEVQGDADPVTGVREVSYYRMTITGSTSLVRGYKLHAGYMSSVTLDTLDGKLPVIPDADLTPANKAAFDTLKDVYLQNLIRYARDVDAPAATTPDDHERQVSRIARQMWFSSLNDADVVSMGQTGSTNPFEFRKLVFYASAETINLKDYDADITSAVDKASTLAHYFAARGRRCRRSLGCRWSTPRAGRRWTAPC